MGNKLATQAATPDANLADVGAGASSSSSGSAAAASSRRLKCRATDGARRQGVLERDLNLSLAHYQELLHEVRVRLTINGAPNVAAFRWFREARQRSSCASTSTPTCSSG